MRQEWRLEKHPGAIPFSSAPSHIRFLNVQLAHRSERKSPASGSGAQEKSNVGRALPLASAGGGVFTRYTKGK
jgi:hypothetical protein